MTIYVPNIGEKEMLKDILLSQAVVLGLYRNQVQPDGNTTIDTLTEMPTGGGRNYAQKALTNDVVMEGSLQANKWRITTNAQGKAEAQYHNAALEWTFNDVDAGDQNTVYGFFAYTWVLPFDGGLKEIRVGDRIKGVTSGAYATVTGVQLQSGAWGTDAAGNLFIKAKNGTFQNDENLTINGAIGTVAVNAGGSGYAVGDILTVVQTGAAGAKLVVTAVNAGAVTSVVVVERGQGYATGTGLSTSALTGSGSGCTVDVSTLDSTAYAVSNTGAGGDAGRQLLFVEPLDTGYLIDTAGQKITYVPKITLSTAA